MYSSETKKKCNIKNENVKKEKHINTWAIIQLLSTTSLIHISNSMSAKEHGKRWKRDKYNILKFWGEKKMLSLLELPVSTENEDLKEKDTLFIANK